MGKAGASLETAAFAGMMVRARSWQTMMIIKLPKSRRISPQWRIGEQFRRVWAMLQPEEEFCCRPAADAAEGNFRF
jgi:hypothetical protein